MTRGPGRVVAASAFASRRADDRWFCWQEPGRDFAVAGVGSVREVVSRGRDRVADLIAEGVVAAAEDLGLQVPLVVRLQGTNAEQGREILANSGLDITPAETLGEAGEKAVAAARAAG